MSFKNLETPCIGICSTVYGDDVCRGCHRFATEVIEWNTYSPSEKSSTLNRLNQLTTEVTEKYLEITDSELLRYRCKSLSIRFRPEFNSITWAYMLLKTRPDKIDAPELFGFRVYSQFAAFNLSQLVSQIDTEIFQQSTLLLQP